MGGATTYTAFVRAPLSLTTSISDAKSAGTLRQPFSCRVCTRRTISDLKTTQASASFPCFTHALESVFSSTAVPPVYASVFVLSREASTLGGAPSASVSSDSEAEPLLRPLRRCRDCRLTGCLWEPSALLGRAVAYWRRILSSLSREKVFSEVFEVFEVFELGLSKTAFSSVDSFSFVAWEVASALRALRFCRLAFSWCSHSCTCWNRPWESSSDLGCSWSSRSMRVERSSREGMVNSCVMGFGAILSGGEPTTVPLACKPWSN